MMGWLLIAVLAVHDGDTLAVNLPCAIDIVCKRMPIRISGIDTPELTDERPAIKLLARQARARVIALTGRTHTVEMAVVGRDKYFRLDADIYSDGVSIAEILKAEGLAKPYTGLGPKPW